MHTAEVVSAIYARAGACKGGLHLSPIAGADLPGHRSWSMETRSGLLLRNTNDRRLEL